MDIDGWGGRLQDFSAGCSEWIQHAPLCHVDAPRAAQEPLHTNTDAIASPAKERVGVFAIWPEGNVGDRGQSVGIAEAIENAVKSTAIAATVRISQESISLNEASADKQAAWLSTLCTSAFAGLDADCFERIIVIGAGSGSNLATILGELSGHPRVTTVFSGHQLTSELDHAAVLPDLVALPKAAASQDRLAQLSDRTQVVLVAGVANPLTREKIAAAAAAYRHAGYLEVPQVDANTVAIILGGDAPDTDGTQRLVTEESVRSLARHIVALERPDEATRFLVTNGPRTGKHALADESGSLVRRDRPGLPDPVTAAFVDELRRLTPSEVHLFVFEPDRMPSAYLPILDQYMTAGANAGHVYVPAESSSMVGETRVVADKRVVSVTQATNDAHMGIVRDELSATGGTIVHLDGRLERIAHRTSCEPDSAAGEIARALLDWIWPARNR